MRLDEPRCRECVTWLTTSCLDCDHPFELHEVGTGDKIHELETRLKEGEGALKIAIEALELIERCSEDWGGEAAEALANIKKDLGK